jgi:hypothetical protein
MATSGLYGNTAASSVALPSGSESSGLYGNNTNFGGTYFEWLIFQEALTAPANPTGGSWSFITNTGTPPTGWSSIPPVNPVNPVWFSISLVNSKNSSPLIWSDTAPLVKQGVPGTAATVSVGTTTTTAPGTTASVVNAGSSSNAILNFGIPRGDVGATGSTGTAATIAVGTTTTGAAGSSALVNNSGSSSAAVFDFTIPQGLQGIQGIQGVIGNTGPAGVSILSVVLTSGTHAPGTLDTYTINYSNSTTSTFQVYNGANGTNSGDIFGPSSATDNAIARFDTTTGKLIQNSIITIDDSGNEAGILSQQFSDGSTVALAAGKMWYDGSTGSWNLGMGNGNITQQVGEEIFVYGKASANITEGQLICKTGVVGSSGQITFGPSPIGLSSNDGIIGVATENISIGNFGRVTFFGIVHGLNTTGSSVGETWIDGDTLYYNPSYVGSMTKTKQVAPNIKFAIATVIHAGNGGSGSIQVNLEPGSTLGATDSNVEINAVANNDLLQYSTSANRWQNIRSNKIIVGAGIGTQFTYFP